MKTSRSLLQLSRLFPRVRLNEFCESFSSDSNLSEKLKSFYLLTDTIDWLQSSSNSTSDIPYDFFTKIRKKAFYQYGTDVTPLDFSTSSPEADGQLSDWLILEADNWHRLDNQKYETRVSVWGYNKHNQLGTRDSRLRKYTVSSKNKRSLFDTIYFHGPDTFSIEISSGP